MTEKPLKVVHEKTYPFPTAKEMRESLKKVESLLAIKRINMYKNAAVKEGLTDCVRILKSRIKKPKNNWFKATKEEDLERANDIYRQQLAGISDLKTETGRTIAVICVDYLNGQVGPECFDKIGSAIKLR
ncbi:MAG: hypothetical protein AAGU19_08015 [Prolixibacteraceae bacterium]